MQKIQDGEIDLLELYQVLWDGKWLISMFVAISVLLGSSIYFLFNDVLYETKFIYSVDTKPHFYKTNRVLKDFEKNFYSKSVFNGWKEINSNKSLIFEDFNVTKVVDGFELLKSKNERLVLLGSENKKITFDGDTVGTYFIIVRSNNLLLLDDFLNYVHYINELQTQEYITRAKSELRIIESRFKDLGSADSSVVNTVLSIDRFIVSIDKGVKVLSFQRPSVPKKITPSYATIFVMSVVLGGMLGVLFIFFRKFVMKSKRQLAKG